MLTDVTDITYKIRFLKMNKNNKVRALVSNHEQKGLKEQSIVVSIKLN